MHALVSGDQAVHMTVLDPYTVRVEVSREFGDYLSRDVLRNPFKVGELGHAGLFVAEVEHVKPDGRADVVRFRFHRRLDDPSLRFFVWSYDRYVPYAMPTVGSPEVRFELASVKHLIRRRFGMTE